MKITLWIPTIEARLPSNGSMKSPKAIHAPKAITSVDTPAGRTARTDSNLSRRTESLPPIKAAHVTSKVKVPVAPARSREFKSGPPIALQVTPFKLASKNTKQYGTEKNAQTQCK